MYRFFSTHYIPLTTPTLYSADVWVTLSYLLVLRSNDISVDWFCGSGVLGMGTAGATPKLFLLNWMANPPIGCIARLVSVRSMYGWPCRLENVPKRQKTSNSKPISCHESLSVPPDIIRQPQVFWCFQKV